MRLVDEEDRDPAAVSSNEGGRESYFLTGGTGIPSSSSSDESKALSSDESVDPTVLASTRSAGAPRMLSSVGSNLCPLISTLGFFFFLPSLSFPSDASTAASKGSNSQYLTSPPCRSSIKCAISDVLTSPPLSTLF